MKEVRVYLHHFEDDFNSYYFGQVYYDVPINDIINGWVLIHYKVKFKIIIDDVLTLFLDEF